MQDKTYDLTITDEQALKYAELFKREGRKVKYNKDGSPTKSQFRNLVRRLRTESIRSKKMKPTQALSQFEKDIAKEHKIKPSEFVLTDEMMEDFQKRLSSGEIGMIDAKKVLLFKYRQDPLYMATRLFRHFTLDRATNEPTPSAKFHHEIMDLYLKHRFTSIAAPRGHSKSTVSGFFYVMHQALFEKKKNIVLVSATQDLAIRFLRDIKTELEVNRKLKWLFGTQKTDKWSEKEIHLANGCRIYAKGAGGQMRGLKEGGQRPDLIVCDDMEDQEMVLSQMRRLKLEDWFNGDVLPTLDPAVGQLIFVGTILHQDALLSRLLNQDIYPDFVSRRYRAITQDGTPLWPERFSLAFLEKTKESFLRRGQLSTFYMEYMNEPSPKEGAVFQQEFFTFFEDLPPFPIADIKMQLFVDLGGGSTRSTADDSAFVVLATDQVSGKMYVHDYVCEQMGVDTTKMVNTIFKLCNDHNITEVFIEKTQAVNMLMPAIERAMHQARKYLKVEYITPPRGAGSQKGDKMSDAKFQRIAAMHSAFKFGDIKIRKHMTKLMDQLLVFPRGTHDDLIDALAYGFMYGKRAKKKKKAKRYVPHRNGYLNR